MHTKGCRHNTYDPLRYIRRRDRRLTKKIEELNKLHPKLEYYIDIQRITIPPKRRGNKYVEEKDSEVICIRKRKRS